MSSISIRNLNKAYGSVDVLKNVNLEIESGEFAVFVGPSGCGKSTLLRCIAGLEDISSGELVIDGALANDTPPAGRGIAMVFQSYALYPHMNVFDNMAYSLKLKKLPKEAIRSKVEAAADKLQLTPYLSRYPKELSGGQRQRVAIGRAIVRDPRVFLFDEPLSNLDAALRVQMRLEIGALKDLLPNTTMIYVTHDQVEAMTMADRIVVLRDGKIEQVGSPLELYERPTSQFVAGFIGSPKMNFLAAPFAAEFGCDVLGVRAEHLSIDRDAGKWAGKVVHSENLGADYFVYVDINCAENLVVRTGGRNMFKIGERVFLTPDANEIHRFGVDGIPMDKP